jgi:hypothetical protein
MNSVHRRDQLFFILVKPRAPFFLRLQIDEKLGIEKSGGVGSVVRAAGLAGALRHFRKGAQRVGGA